MANPYAAIACQDGNKQIDSSDGHGMPEESPGLLWLAIPQDGIPKFLALAKRMSRQLEGIEKTSRIFKSNQMRLTNAMHNFKKATVGLSQATRGLII